MFTSRAEYRTLLRQDNADLRLTPLAFELGLVSQDRMDRVVEKQEKTDLFHIAICTLLEPYGYYKFEGRDEESWPHFKLLKTLPPLEHREQQHLMKQSMLDYFIANDYYSEDA